MAFSKTSGFAGTFLLSECLILSEGLKLNRLSSAVVLDESVYLRPKSPDNHGPNTVSGATKPMSVKIQVVFYSMYGHIYKMAEAIAEGARSVGGSEVRMLQVPELVPDAALERTGALAARAAFKTCAHRSNRRTGRRRCHYLWHANSFRYHVQPDAQLSRSDRGALGKGGLIGKVGSVFTSTGTQHGGHETTITSFHTTLLHHGMIIVGVPYACQELTNMSEITGGSPYGAGALAGADGSRPPSANELAIARFQGKHVAEITQKLKGYR